MNIAKNVLFPMSWLQRKLEERRLRRLIRQIMTDEPHLAEIPVRKQ